MDEKFKRIERRIVYDAGNPSKNTLHVIYSGRKGWSIVPDGKLRAIRILPSKQIAISFAKNYLDEGEITIHNTDGTVNSNIIVRYFLFHLTGWGSFFE